ncbi:MAG: hypothetical protein J2P54_19600, partial [Bradyrhizobiaceae bacterium]|nr:hypothetical protein [Bradyrhizobiaceae bacterium]
MVAKDEPEPASLSGADKAAQLANEVLAEVGALGIPASAAYKATAQLSRHLAPDDRSLRWHPLYRLDSARFYLAGHNLQRRTRKAAPRFTGLHWLVSARSSQCPFFLIQANV